MTQNNTSIDWDWLKKRIMATPVRREKIGGQSVSYIERDSVIAYIEEAKRKSLPSVTLGDWADQFNTQTNKEEPPVLVIDSLTSTPPDELLRRIHDHNNKGGITLKKEPMAARIYHTDMTDKPEPLLSEHFYGNRTTFQKLSDFFRGRK